MPSSLHDRYVELYQKFGKAWRVTNQSSLFDYAPGNSTATFTLESWPMEQPPCLLPDARPVEPASLEVARQACAGIRDQQLHADCVFDVQVTGEVGFAETYRLTEDRTPSEGGARPHFQCYRVDRPTPESEDRVVKLRDQFGKTEAKLGRITRICTPVDKNGEGIPDEDLHLVCYEITNPQDARRPVSTTNQFGRAKMYVRESEELCVPSGKRELER
jgi:hypothetical protein